MIFPSNSITIIVKLLKLYKKNNTLDARELELLMENGSEFTFETIYRTYYTRILHIATNYLQSRENAEEITQNVFLKLWREIDDIKKISNIGGYLFRITRNGCLDFLKHEKVKTDFAQKTKLKVDLQYVRDDASALLIQNELMDKIEEGINLLPEKCKKIFIHSRFEGLKNKEIASIYNLSKRTVDNHIAKGIRHMKLHLKDFAVFLLFYFIS